MGVAVPLVMMGISAMGAYAQADQNAKAVDAAYRDQEEANLAARLLTADSYADLGAAKREIEEESLEASLTQQKEYIQAVGRVNLIAGASGTFGGSVDSMLRDLRQTRGANVSKIVKNRNTQLEGLYAEARNIERQGLASQTTRTFHKPSALATGLGIAGAGLQGYSAGLTLKRQYTESRKKPEVLGGAIGGGVE
jgi:hypothetical protein